MPKTSQAAGERPRQRRASLGPRWPSKGPDRGENILLYKRDALSPEFQERWDEAATQASPLGKEVARLREEVDRVRERFDRLDAQATKRQRERRSHQETGPVLLSERE